jgi:hypothetical protein
MPGNISVSDARDIVIIGLKFPSPPDDAAAAAACAAVLRYHPKPQH